VYGTSSLWYLIADANGLTAESSLTEGNVITIPNTAQTGRIDSQRFKVYNASEIEGSKMPNLAAPGLSTCQQIAQVVSVVVSLVVTAYFGPIAGNLAGQLIRNVAGIQHGFDAKSLGMAVVSEFLPHVEIIEGGGLAAAAVNGAVNNAISQGVFIATGLQDKFDWKQVAAAGVGGAVSYQVNDWMSNLQINSDGASKASSGNDLDLRTTKALPDVTLKAGSLTEGWGTAFIRTAVTNMATNVATSLVQNGKVDWTAAALSGISAGLGNAAVDAIKETAWGAEQYAKRQSEQGKNVIRLNELWSPETTFVGGMGSGWARTNSGGAATRSNVQSTDNKNLASSANNDFANIMGEADYDPMHTYGENYQMMRGGGGGGGGRTGSSGSEGSSGSGGGSSSGGGAGGSSSAGSSTGGDTGGGGASAAAGAGSTTSQGAGTSTASAGTSASAGGGSVTLGSDISSYTGPSASSVLSSLPDIGVAGGGSVSFSNSASNYVGPDVSTYSGPGVNSVLNSLSGINVDGGGVLNITSPVSDAGDGGGRDYKVYSGYLPKELKDAHFARSAVFAFPPADGNGDDLQGVYVPGRASNLANATGDGKQKDPQAAAYRIIGRNELNQNLLETGVDTQKLQVIDKDVEVPSRFKIQGASNYALVEYTDGSWFHSYQLDGKTLYSRFYDDNPTGVTGTKSQAVLPDQPVPDGSMIGKSPEGSPDGQQNGKLNSPGKEQREEVGNGTAGKVKDPVKYPQPGDGNGDGGRSGASGKGDNPNGDIGIPGKVKRDGIVVPDYDAMAKKESENLVKHYPVPTPLQVPAWPFKPEDTDNKEMGKQTDPHFSIQSTPENAYGLNKEDLHKVKDFASKSLPLAKPPEDFTPYMKWEVENQRVAFAKAKQGPKAEAWDGVVRYSPAETMRHNLDPYSRSTIGGIIYGISKHWVGADEETARAWGRGGDGFEVARSAGTGYPFAPNKNTPQAPQRPLYEPSSQKYVPLGQSNVASPSQNNPMNLRGYIDPFKAPGANNASEFNDITRLNGRGAYAPKVIATNNGRFQPASRSGLFFEEGKDKYKGGSKSTVDFVTRQRIYDDGSIKERLGEQSYINTTFDSKTGHLFIDSMAAQPGRHIGREMISRVIEKIGPEKIRSIGAEFDDKNGRVFMDSLKAEMTPKEAAANTPLGRALRDLGYEQYLHTVDPGKHPRPSVLYVIEK
ncbi:hypothetical protein ACO0LC_28175, partial [Undibacterium sp. JH2W]